MKFARRLGLAAAATLIGLGIISATSSGAQADTSWGQKRVTPDVPVQTVQVMTSHDTGVDDTSWGQR